MMNILFETNGYKFSLTRIQEGVFYDKEDKELVVNDLYEACWEAMKENMKGGNNE